MSTETKKLTISQLEPKQSDIEVRFKVVGKSEPREVFSRRDDSVNKVSDVIVGDDTATVVVSAWNETIDKLETGVTFTLSSAHTGLYQGHLRLKLSNDSSLEVDDEPIEEVNETIDMSAANHRPRRSSYGRQQRGSHERRSSWL